MSTDTSPDTLGDTTGEAAALEAERREAVFTSERPWGRFQQFVLNQQCTVKIITVSAGHRLSLQRHTSRDEMWQVLDVPLDVQVGTRTWTAQVGEIVYTPAGELHRLGNSGDRDGRILEVGFGTFDESDIERLEDDYTRG